ncbi:hypothetical protein REPUB_Repub08aG0089700 [Reevesia pubescens]
MFAHVSSERDSFGETISTLKFAHRVSIVELGAAHLNKESSEVMQLKEAVNKAIQALLFMIYFSPYMFNTGHFGFSYTSLLLQ